MALGVSRQQEQPLIGIEIAERSERRRMIVERIGRFANVLNGGRTPRKKGSDEIGGVRVVALGTSASNVSARCDRSRIALTTTPSRPRVASALSRAAGDVRI